MARKECFLKVGYRSDKKGTRCKENAADCWNHLQKTSLMEKFNIQGVCTLKGYANSGIWSLPCEVQQALVWCLSIKETGKNCENCPQEVLGRIWCQIGEEWQRVNRLDQGYVHHSGCLVSWFYWWGHLHVSVQIVRRVEWLLLSRESHLWKHVALPTTPTCTPLPTLPHQDILLSRSQKCTKREILKCSYTDLCHYGFLRAGWHRNSWNI